MTTIDKSKLKRIITQCGSEDKMDIIRAVWSAAQSEEREECARIVDSIGYSHTAGLSQYISSEFARAAQKIRGK